MRSLFFLKNKKQLEKSRQKIYEERAQVHALVPKYQQDPAVLAASIPVADAYYDDIKSEHREQGRQAVFREWHARIMLGPFSHIYFGSSHHVKASTLHFSEAHITAPQNRIEARALLLAFSNMIIRLLEEKLNTSPIDSQFSICIEEAFDKYYSDEWNNVVVIKYHGKA